MVLDAPHKLTGFGHPARSGQCVETSVVHSTPYCEPEGCGLRGGKYVKWRSGLMGSKFIQNCVKAGGRRFFVGKGKVLEIQNQDSPIWKSTGHGAKLTGNAWLEW